jgi:hypothetical protein
VVSISAFLLTRLSFSHYNKYKQFAEYITHGFSTDYLPVIAVDDRLEEINDIDNYDA